MRAIQRDRFECDRLDGRGKWHRLEHLLWRLFYLSTVILLSINTSLAAIVPANPNNYRALLKTLLPGDTLLLQTGTYESGLSIRDMHGDPGHPIIISGPENGFPAVFLGSKAQAWNTIQINNSSHITIRFLKLDGLGIDGIDGVNARGITHHITLEHLKILRHGGSQLTVAIATRGPAWDWVIRNNLIIGAGTGLYLGNPQGIGWPFVGGLIEYNVILDTLGYNMQIKHMRDRYDDKRNPVAGMPSETRNTVIRHNVFSKANQGTENEDPNGKFGPRPNLLVGHLPLSGPGSDDVYEIYGNFFYQNPTEALFQGEGNIALYNNIFLNDSGTAINIQAHKDKPRQVNIFYNTIVASRKGIRIKGLAAGYTAIVKANAVFAGQPLVIDSKVDEHDNFTDSFRAASRYLYAPDEKPGTLDLFPKAGALQIKSVNPSFIREFQDGGLDFNGTNRTSYYQGAYVGGENNPGWFPQLDFKPHVPENQENHR